MDLGLCIARPWSFNSVVLVSYSRAQCLHLASGWETEFRVPMSPLPVSKLICVESYRRTGFVLVARLFDNFRRPPSVVGILAITVQKGLDPVLGGVRNFG
jgi:hypothetical protein